jgi:hypothetical protein
MRQWMPRLQLMQLRGSSTPEQVGSSWTTAIEQQMQQHLLWSGGWKRKLHHDLLLLDPAPFPPTVSDRG